MKRVCTVLAGCTLLLAACNSSPTAPESATSAVSEMAAANDKAPKLTGTGDHTRIVAGVSALTSFSFTAIGEADGSAKGHYDYNFRAAGFEVRGPVTCISQVGNQVWVGGIVEDVVTDNPDFEVLKGLEMWWRSTDNGEGANAPPDMTTGLGFGFAGSTVTAASWCANKPLTLIARAVEGGNLQVH
ncbi:MAG: hypothetical protein ABIZ70_11040 [Gemmatimonadales bacterium]